MTEKERGLDETYVNAPLPPEIVDALKKQAKANGRCPGRELAQIAIRALVKKARAAEGCVNKVNK